MGCKWCPALDADAARWHRIKPARVERSAFHKAARGEPRAGEHAVLTNGADRVVRTGWREAAAASWPEECRQCRRKCPLVKPDTPEQQAGGQRPDEGEEFRGGCVHEAGGEDVEIWRQASENFCASSGIGRSVAAPRAMNRRSQPAGTRCCWWRKTSRNRRLARLRRTAAPTAAVEAITQTRGAEFAKAPAG